MIIALGILFWSTNGLVTMPSLIPTSALARWQENVGVLSSTGAQIGVIVALALLALGLWWRWDRRRHLRTEPTVTLPATGPVKR